MKILLLTNNLLYEQGLQEKLQILCYETYCSEQLFNTEGLRDLARVSQFFDLLILSETISQQQIQDTSVQMSNIRIPIIRKYGTTYNRKQGEVREEFPTISHDSSLEQLRDTLTEIHYKDAEKVFSNCHRKINLNEINFSMKEKTILEVLISSSDSVVSRREMIEAVLKRKESKSTQSQISTLVKNIRRKLLENKIPSDMLQTFWGQGYVLDEAFFDYVQLPEELEMAPIL